MEWRKSDISGAELERKRREYIEAAMSLSRRAAPDTAAEKPLADTAAPPAEEIIPKSGPEPQELREPEELHEPEELPETAEEREPEAPEPEQIEKKPEKKTFGVFDMEQLSEAVRNGEMDGDKLREAAEILEEMNRKTGEMEKLAGKAESLKSGGQPQSLNRYIEQHNKGSYPQRGGRHGTNGS